MDVLGEVWREACRHIEIDEFILRVAPLLERRLATDLVLVRRVDLRESRLETAAVAGRDATRRALATSTACTRDDIEQFVVWCREGAVRHGPASGDDRLLRLAAPQEIDGPVLAAPLVEEDGPLGALVLTRRARRFTQADAAFAASLREPVAAALANHRRVHEMTRLRETAEAENRALRTRLQRVDITDSIVGAETGLRSVMERAAQVAPTDAPVLILGETGSGKEVVARCVHERSRRAAGPFLRVNCGAIPGELVDWELFGHERGSFTGAVSARKGWFERADGGTLFLDEVAELPLAAQVRLLRVLQDGSYQRVGGQGSLAGDVRIVTATHRDVAAMVAARTFREDLWYRISVFPIRLPPLRERPEDIPALAAHFATRAGMRLHGAPMSPSAADLLLLVAYSWPGNVRELASVIERAVILGNGRGLDVVGSMGLEPAPARASAVERRAALAEASQVVPLQQAMTRHIELALAQTQGRIEGRHGAAALLQINPHTLRARMRKMGVDWQRFRGDASPTGDYGGRSTRAERTETTR